MRLIVACARCARQFDATGRREGSRFRCKCGDIVEVKSPEKSHEARVVRCAACGAPRDSSGSSCRYCNAEFTLHDRDLGTVCPNCFARCSDRSRFCPECATPIAPEGELGGESEHGCPACEEEQRLHSRRLGSSAFSVLECGRCAGLWLAAHVFSHLEQQAQKEAVAEGAGASARRAPPARGDHTVGGRLYRPCIECGKLMHRLNYGKRSGVIVDICKEHGVWFDAEELERIVAWIRQGGMAESRKRDAFEAREDERRKRIEIPTHDPGETSWRRGVGGYLGGSSVDTVFDALEMTFDLFDD